MHRYRLPILPVRNTILFPNQIVPLAVGRPGSLGAVDAVTDTEGKLLAVFAQRDPAHNDPGLDDLQRLGVRAAIRRVARAETGLQVEVRGIERVRLLDVVARSHYLEAIVESSPVDTAPRPDVDSLQRSLYDLVSRVVSHGRERITAEHLASQISDPLQIAYLVASIAPLSMDQMKALMAAQTVQEALQASIDALTRKKKPEAERPLLALPMPASATAAEPKRHPDTARLRERLERAGLPREVKDAALQELKRLQQMPPASPDRVVAERWLHLMADLPWTRPPEP